MHKTSDAASPHDTCHKRTDSARAIEFLGWPSRGWKAAAVRPVVLCCVAAAVSNAGIAAERERRLHGSRASIDAADYESLQAAIDALPETGGVVRIPNGAYEIAQPLVIEKDDVHLQGDGTATLLTNVNRSGRPAIVSRHPHPASRADRVWRLQISDLRLVGNDASGHGIEATGVNEIFLHGVTISYHGGDGIRLVDCYEDPRINDSLITYNKQTGLMMIGCHDMVVSGNHFEENQDAVRCADGFNLCLTGNNIDDHLRHGVVIENTYSSVVTGNMLEQCHGMAILLDRDAYGTTLSANVFGHQYGGGIELRDAHGCAVTGNTFVRVPTGALVIGPEAARIAVTGNTFSNSYIGAGQLKRADDDHASGIVLREGASHLVISGNSFMGVTTKAVAIEGKPAAHVVFSGNLLGGAKSDHARLLDSMIEGNIE